MLWYCVLGESESRHQHSSLALQNACQAHAYWVASLGGWRPSSPCNVGLLADYGLFNPEMLSDWAFGIGKVRDTVIL